MFNTFAVVEPEVGENNPYLPGGEGECLVARMLNYKDMISFLETSTLNKSDVEKCKQARIKKMAEEGIIVPEDFDTLKEAAAFVHDNHESTDKYVDQNGRPRLINQIVLKEGTHMIKTHWQQSLKITSAMNIVGRGSKEKIKVVGGIYFEERIQGNCHLQNLTLCRTNGYGVLAESSCTMADVVVKECNRGVIAVGNDVVVRCSNLEVTGCKKAGVTAIDGASITLIDPKTSVHHNCVIRKPEGEYGLYVFGGSSSTIQLVSPLTKEEVSVSNGVNEFMDFAYPVGQDFGVSMGADINQIKTITEAVAEAEAASAATDASAAYAAYLRGEVRVPQDFNMLVQAVQAVHENGRLTTVVLGRGEHQIEDGIDNLHVSSAMNIVGDPSVPKEEIVVGGRIHIQQGIPENCHLQHFTVTNTSGGGIVGSGVYAESSFTMEDVLVEQCGGEGVYAYGTGTVARCTNVEVRQCGKSGVLAYGGASVTLIGANTKVHHNCTQGHSDDYGLTVSGPSSNIQLVHPLTKNIVSTDNAGGANWGGIQYVVFEGIAVPSDVNR